VSVRLFVGNLSYDVTEADLKTLFGEVGAVKMVRVPVDRETGRPRGFAFVDFGERAEGDEAINRFHQQMFMGRQLAVSEAVAREDAPRGPPRPMGNPLGGPPPRMGGPMGGPSGGPAPARTFGPDALPRNKRKPVGGKGAGGENKPKGPIKESGARAFGRGVEDEEGDGDEVPFWAIDDGKAGENDEE